MGLGFLTERPKALLKIEHSGTVFLRKAGQSLLRTPFHRLHEMFSNGPAHYYNLALRDAEVIYPPGCPVPPTEQWRLEDL